MLKPGHVLSELFHWVIVNNFHVIVGIHSGSSQICVIHTVTSAAMSNGGPNNIQQNQATILHQGIPSDPLEASVWAHEGRLPSMSNPYWYYYPCMQFGCTSWIWASKVWVHSHCTHCGRPWYQSIMQVGGVQLISEETMEEGATDGTMENP